MTLLRSVALYQKFWKIRCKKRQEISKQKLQLVTQIEEIQDLYNNSPKQDIRRYVSKCPENFRVQSPEFLVGWVRGFYLMRKNAPEYEVEDILSYFNSVRD